MSVADLDRLEKDLKAAVQAGPTTTGKVAVTAKATATGDTEIDAITVGADGTTNTSNRLAVSDHLKVFNGATWDRIRTAVSDAMAATGLMAAGLMGFNGTTWDRLKATGGLLQVLSRTEQYTAPATGEVAGSVTSGALPNVPGKLVSVKARLSNAGNVYVGVGTATKAAGTTTTTAGYELGPGDATPWIPTDNLNRLSRICDNAGDALTYLVLA